MSLGVTYQGWSGCVLVAPGGIPLYFDPAPGSALPDQKKIVFITHGHPEHVEGIASHLRSVRENGISVLGSSSVCKFLKTKSSNRADSFLAVNEGSSLSLHGWSVDVFGWEHMSLLPAGWKEKGTYLKRLLRHPVRLAKIGVHGLSGPRHAPMLGYRVSGYGRRIVYFGEGLHRCTSDACLRVAMGNEPVDVLLAAVEPEDAQDLPRLVMASGARQLLAFEAHRPWREQFELPQINLSDLRNGLPGVKVWSPAPGEAVEI